MFLFSNAFESHDNVLEYDAVTQTINVDDGLCITITYTVVTYETDLFGNVYQVTTEYSRRICSGPNE